MPQRKPQQSPNRHRKGDFIFPRPPPLPLSPAAPVPALPPPPASPQRVAAAIPRAMLPPHAAAAQQQAAAPRPRRPPQAESGAGGTAGDGEKAALGAGNTSPQGGIKPRGTRYARLGDELGGLGGPSWWRAARSPWNFALAPLPCKNGAQ